MIRARRDRARGRPALAAGLAAAALAVPAAAAAQDHAGPHHAGHDSHARHRAMAAGGAGDRGAIEVGAALDIPDVPVVDQTGTARRFYSDLVAGKTVAVNFVFTTCTTICPPMGANFGRLRKELGARAGRDLHLISVSVDPVTDTPERLAAWAEKFGAGAGWTLVTGERGEITRLLKALEVFNADITDHSPVVLIGNDAAGEWTRAHGLAPPAKLEELLGEAAAAGPSAARTYFTDTVLVDQDGRELRFYSDLVAGRTVVIHSMFTDCTGSCPVMSRKYQAVQEHLGERIGRDVHLIQITVDPRNDTPARLKAHAEKFGAGPGWHLLTGTPENVERVLRRLGQWVDERETHENIFLVGNDRTGLWKKAFGLAKTEELVALVDSVVDDPGAP